MGIDLIESVKAGVGHEHDRSSSRSTHPESIRAHASNQSLIAHRVIDSEVGPRDQVTGSGLLNPGGLAWVLSSVRATALVRRVRFPSQGSDQTREPAMEL